MSPLLRVVKTIIWGLAGVEITMQFSAHKLRSYLAHLLCTTLHGSFLSWNPFKLAAQVMKRCRTSLGQLSNVSRHRAITLCRAVGNALQVAEGRCCQQKAWESQCKPSGALHKWKQSVNQGHNMPHENIHPAPPHPLYPSHHCLGDLQNWGSRSSTISRRLPPPVE